MTTTFETLGVSRDLVAALQRSGIDAPFPIQALTIPDAMEGRDLCGKAKTGSGKTLAFGLPLLERVGKAKARRPTGLVLVPTRELANQVHKVMAPLAGEIGVAVTLMLWNEENAIRTVQRRLGLSEPIVEVFSNDPRLADLHAWGRSADLVEDQLAV